MLFSGITHYANGAQCARARTRARAACFESRAASQEADTQHKQQLERVPECSNIMHKCFTAQRIRARNST